MSFLRQVKTKYRVEALLSPRLKDILGEPVWAKVEQTMQKLQSEVARHLADVDKVISESLEGSPHENKLVAVQQNVRTSLSKWIYLSRMK